MKKIFLLLTLLMLSFTFVSCNKEKDELSQYDKDVKEAIEYFDQFTPEELDLPTYFHEYSLIADDDYMIIFDDVKTICINAFVDLGERMENMGGFYYDVNSKQGYIVDYLTGDYKSLEENK